MALPLPYHGTGGTDMDGSLDNVLNLFDVAEKKEKAAVKRAKKAAKPPETIEEAEQRILGMKLKPEEVEIVKSIFRLYNEGKIEIPEGKHSKKSTFESWAKYKELIREEKRKHVLETRPDNFWIVQDLKTLNKVRAMLETEPLTAWDTETYGLDIFNHGMCGYSFYMPNHDVAVYVAFNHTTGQKQVSMEAALLLAKDYLENPNNQTIWHHFKFDGHILANYGITVANPYWDTQIVSKLLNEHESHRLKELYAKYILGKPDEAILFEDLFDDFVIYDKDIILSGIYAAGDGEKTYKLYQFQKPYIDTRDNLKTVWYQIEQKLMPVDLAMERTGFRIDLVKLEGLAEKFEPILQQASKEIIDSFNIDEQFVETMAAAMGKTADEIGEFNIQSPQHLGYLIYDVLGADPNIGLKFKKAARSTAGDVIDALCKNYEELKPLLTYRQLFKLVSTYIRKIPEAMEPKTGRLHARFNNLSGDDGKSGAATGRYSSSEYVSGKNSATGDHAKGTNFQNISSKGEGVLIRMCFVPDDAFLFVSSDLSQIEPRIISVILAEQFGDTAMQDMYLAGVDLYTTMAMKTFDLPYEQCVDGAYADIGYGLFSPRKLMKQGVLSYLYGTSAGSFARAMKVSLQTAEIFFGGMLREFNGLEPFRQETIKSLLTVGNIAHVSTLFGRKRRFPEYRQDYAELQKLNRIPRTKITKVEQDRRNELWRRCAAVERQAINTIIQGSAADVLKQIMIALFDYCKQNDFMFHCSIHDEVMTSIPKSKLTRQVIQDIDRIMTQTVTFSTPLKADTVIQPVWMEEYSAADGWDFEKCCPVDAAIAKRLKKGLPCSFAQAV